MFSPDTTTAYLLLGTNMGHRSVLLEKAIQHITHKVGSILRLSSVYETAAWGNEQQPKFLNQALSVATRFAPIELLAQVHSIEQRLGRQRKTKWEPRPIDIDILLYGDQVVNTPRLQIPHPHLPNRRFALVPLHEIAPELRHPVSLKTITELLTHTPDQLPVYLLKQPTMSNTSFKEANMGYLQDLSGGNPHIIREILELFIKQTPEDVKLLAAYIEQAHWEKVYQQAHHIKPTMSYVGAEAIRAEIQEIEDWAKNRNKLDKLPEKFHALQSRLDTLYRELNGYLESIG